MSVVDLKTPRLQLPLPNGSNFLADDVLRLIQAITKLDQIVATTDVLSSFVASTDLMSALQSKVDSSAVAGILSGYALLGGSSTQTFFVGNSSQAGHAVNQGQLYGRAGSGGGLSFRNKIIDGRFDFWYEGTSQATSGYGSDTMWCNAQVGGSKVHTRQLLTAGADLPAIEVPSAKYFSRTVVTSVAGSSNQVRKYQAIEDVRTLAGKTVTVSFYAKADASKNIALSFEQNFGSGGSTTLLIPVSLVSLTTTWARYSRTVTLPSVSGKTIGADDGVLVFSLWFDAGSTYNGIALSLGQRSGTYDVCCIQIEEGSIATPFEELPIEVSQKRIERYYEEGVYHNYIGTNANTNGFISGLIFYRTVKRSTPVIYFWGDSIRGTLQNNIRLTDDPAYSSNTIISSKSTSLQVIHTAAAAEPRTLLGFYYVADARL